MIFVNENKLETEFENITKADLLSYIVKDLLHQSNIGGMHMSIYSNEPKITDNEFYMRELRFVINSPNFMADHGSTNRYDRFRYGIQ
jgi:hypothetical protein